MFTIKNIVELLIEYGVLKNEIELFDRGFTKTIGKQNENYLNTWKKKKNKFHKGFFK